MESQSLMIDEHLQKAKRSKVRQEMRLDDKKTQKAKQLLWMLILLYKNRRLVI